MLQRVRWSKIIDLTWFRRKFTQNVKPFLLLESSLCYEVKYYRLRERRDSIPCVCTCDSVFTSNGTVLVIHALIRLSVDEFTRRSHISLIHYLNLSGKSLVMPTSLKSKDLIPNLSAGDSGFSRKSPSSQFTNTEK